MQDRNYSPTAPSRSAPASVLPDAGAARRVNHGSSAWSLPSRQPSGIQPQDGSLTNPPRVAAMPSRANGGKVAGETDDSRITGGTRSLSRRVLGLNNVTADGRTPDESRMPVPAEVA